MTLRPSGVRVRLTLWYSLVLAGTVLVLSVFVFLFVRARLLGHLNLQLESDFKAVSQDFLEDPNESPEIETENSVQIFQIVKAGSLHYQTARSRSYRNGTARNLRRVDCPRRRFDAADSILQRKNR